MGTMRNYTNISIIFFSKDNNLKNLSPYLITSSYNEYLKDHLKDFIPYFTYKDGRFYTTENNWDELLLKEEINFIEENTKSYLEVQKPTKANIGLNLLAFKIVYAIAKLLSRISFNISKIFLEIIFAFNIKKRLFNLFEKISKANNDFKVIIQNRFDINTDT